MAKRERALEAMVDANGVLPDADFWRGKRVALTGHTGFKGSWMALLLHRLGATLVGYALPPSTTPNLFDSAQVGALMQSQFGDLRDGAALQAWLSASQPEIVLHLAAQALVRESYRDPVNTMTSNFVGTLHLLEAVRHVPSVRAVVVVTTDKVYRNEENGHSYCETDRLGGHDPYSASKAACELLVDSYRSSFLSEIGLATARAGNVIGGGDWSPERLIPDAVKAWTEHRALDIRSPDAVRPWQHVLEPLCAYLVLAQRLWTEPKMGCAFNFGPAASSAVSVRTVIEQARSYFGQGEVRFGADHNGPHEAGLLHLNASLAARELSVMPRWDLATALQKSMHWYRAFATGSDARALCNADIESYFF